MNEDESVLAELRKLGAWADMQRKITKWSLIFVAVFIPAFIIFAIVMENRLNGSTEDVRSPDKPDKPTWTDVDWKTRRGDLDEAIRIGEELLQRTPQYPEGHHRLASAYLAAGKTEQAREHYAQAFHLFPSEENEKLLIAIERRIKEGTPQSGAASGSQPIRPETNSTPSTAGSRR
jgi:tetratricopeptide (TPR) repeat protein